MSPSGKTIDAARARRSALYLPASNARAIEKSRGLDCDVVILDLEDAVAPEAKGAARDAAMQALKAGGFAGKELVVRVNGLGTPWGEADLAALRHATPDAVLVPKIDGVGDVARYDRAMIGLPTEVQLWAMIETTACLFRLDQTAAASTGSRLSTFVLGTNDLAEEMGATLTVARQPFLWAMGLTVAAARAHRLSVLDGVFNALEDPAGLAEQCRQASDFGFDGKTLIHPNQIATCNAAFLPSAEAIRWAEAVVAEFSRTENVGKGAIRIEGTMVERLHLAKAHRLLAVDLAVRRRGPGA